MEPGIGEEHRTFVIKDVVENSFSAAKDHLILLAGIALTTSCALESAIHSGLDRGGVATIIAGMATSLFVDYIANNRPDSYDNDHYIDP